jgi:hypothetical protein
MLTGEIRLLRRALLGWVKEPHASMPPAQVHKVFVGANFSVAKAAPRRPKKNPRNTEKFEGRKNTLRNQQGLRLWKPERYVASRGGEPYNQQSMASTSANMQQQSLTELMSFRKSWRVYQARLLDQLDRYLANKRFHLVAAPGSGKTVLGLEVVRRINQPTLVLAPTITHPRPVG